MTTVIEIPLNSGMDQGTDGVLQGQDKLMYVQNARLARDGRLEVRPSFTALSTATMSSGTMMAFDLATYRNRLVALGDQLGNSRATDLFEWQPARSAWRATAGADVGTQATRLGALTDVRSVGALPDQFRAVHSVKLATGAGYVCAVINYSSGVFGNSGAIGSMVHIFDPATDQTLFFEPVALRMATVVFAGTRFFIVGADANNDLTFFSFNPSSSQTMLGPTVIATMTLIDDVAATPFNGGWFVAAIESASNVELRRMSNAGVVLGTPADIAGTFNAVAVSGGPTRVSVVTRVTATGLTAIRTYSTADALVVGPTTLFATTGTTALAATPRGAFVDVVSILGSDAAHSTIAHAVDQSSHAFSGPTTYFDTRLTCAGVNMASAGFRTFYGFCDYEAMVQDSVGTTHIADITNAVDLTPQAFLLPRLAAPDFDGVYNHVCQAASAGTKVYFPVISISQDLGTGTRKARYNIFEAETAGTGRRQMSQIGGELLIAGGLPMVYDGRAMVEQGFAEQPCILSIGQSTAGALTPLATYTGIAVWECFDGNGRLLRSQASKPKSVTLVGANNDVTWGVSTPHSLRRHPTYADQAISVRVSIYRTEAGEGVFFLDEQVTIDPTDVPAEFVAITSTQSDTFLIDNAILYEQSQAAISNVSPPPYRYSWPTRERLLVAGLPDFEEWTESKLLFPGEPLEWANFGRLGFSGRVGQPITAVASFETAGLIWTEQEIWQIPGRGPEHNGTGEFDPSTPLAAPGGTFNWQSVIVAPPGAFFQMMDDRLMLLDRGGGVEWIGSPVQDTLALYPVITGCVFVRQLDIVAFACNNSAGTDGVFLVFDLTNQQWFVDTIGAPISAVTEFDGRLVYSSAGAVFLQDLTIGLGVGALPTLRFDTPSYRFFSAGGYGDIYKVCLIGTYLGDSTIEGFISYDDGKTWTTMGSFAVTSAAMVNATTGAALASGDPITLIWQPASMQVDRFRVRFDMTNATATGGLRFHVLSLEVNAVQGTTRQSAQRQR